MTGHGSKFNRQEGNRDYGVAPSGITRKPRAQRISWIVIARYFNELRFGWPKAPDNCR